MDIKEIALKVGLQAFEEHPYDKGHVVSPSGYTWIDDKLIEFAESLIAEVAKQNEPVAEVLSLFPGEPDSYINARAIGVDPFNTWTFPQPGTKLYTSDQVAAAVLKATKPIDGVAKPAGYFQVEFYGGNPMHQQVGSQYQAELGVFPLYTAEAVTVAVNQFKEQLAKAEQRIAEIEAENERLKAECDDVKQVQFSRKLEAVAVGWKKRLAAEQKEIERLNGQISVYRLSFVELERQRDVEMTSATRWATGYHELRDQLAVAQEENGRLENQVLARDAELWGRTQEILGLKEQLAAEQLNNKLLRKALKMVTNKVCWSVFTDSEETQTEEALAQPSDTSALDKHVAEKVKEYGDEARRQMQHATKAVWQRDLAVDAITRAIDMVGHPDNITYLQQTLDAIKESEAK